MPLAFNYRHPRTHTASTENTNVSNNYSSSPQTPKPASRNLLLLSNSTNLPPKPKLNVRDTVPISLSDQSASPSTPTLIETITLSLSGVSFSYNLGSMKSDPYEITELLKVTSSERGNWILVAAYYRRKCNPRAAIFVIQALLEGQDIDSPIPLIRSLPDPPVMARHNVPEQALKSAYLLLSGCEKDLGKQTQKGSTESAEHDKRAQTWLQKVYGTFTLDISPGKPSVLSIPKMLPSPERRPTSDTIAHKMDLPPPTRSQGHDKILQREIQSLRDRLDHQKNLLADVRASKRKLEVEYDMERNLRRKLERYVDDLRRERDYTRETDYRYSYEH
ncbi:hypothetical protein L218DRAFT_1077285 [Marasmius fiardii PR-910]|nr:hypothetical protein L218DRAFT_1077285 [Marasmius fiardii PR-910]